MKPRRGTLLLALALVASPGVVRAQTTGMPAELDGIGIVEKPGVELPRDLTFTDQDGKSVKLGEYFDGQRPVVLVLAYYECPMLCTMVLNGLEAGLKQLAWKVGDNFRVVTVSIDPRDTVERARAKRENQIASYGRAIGPREWDFLVSDAATSKQLADAVGFHYRWDPVGKQFAHAAGAFVITPQGKLSRTLFGITFPEKSLRLALLEASQGKLGNAWDHVLLFCYHYDPAARGYVLGARRVMKAGGVLTVLGLGLLFALLARRKSTSVGKTDVPPSERVV